MPKISFRGESADLFFRIMALSADIDKLNDRLVARDAHNERYGTSATDPVIIDLENKWDELLNERNKLVSRLNKELL